MPSVLRCRSSLLLNDQKGVSELIIIVIISSARTLLLPSDLCTGDLNGAQVSAASLKQYQCSISQQEMKVNRNARFHNILALALGARNTESSTLQSFSLVS